MADTYWQDVDGGVWKVFSGDSPLPGWTSISLTTYNAAVVARDAAIAQNKIDHEEANCATKQQAYNDLKASVHTSDWPESLFFFLTGFTPGDC